MGDKNMTRKDYRRIAKVIRGIVDNMRRVDAEDAYRMSEVRRLARLLGESFAEENPKFNYSNFMEACGFPHE